MRNVLLLTLSDYIAAAGFVPERTTGRPLTHNFAEKLNINIRLVKKGISGFN